MNRICIEASYLQPADASMLWRPSFLTSVCLHVYSW